MVDWWIIISSGDSNPTSSSILILLMLLTSKEKEIPLVVFIQYPFPPLRKDKLPSQAPPILIAATPSPMIMLSDPSISSGKLELISTEPSMGKEIKLSPL